MPIKPKEDTSLYRPVLAEAWQFARRNKKIWIFGLCASFAASGGIYDIVLRSWNDAFGRRLAATLPSDAVIPAFRDMATAALARAQGLPPALIVALLVALLVVAFVVWIAVTSQGAVIFAVRGDRKKSSDPRAAFHAGLRHFWPVLLVDLGVKLLLALFVMINSYPAERLITNPSAQNAGIYVVTFLIAIPLSLVTLLLSVYTMTAIVVRGEGVVDALRSALRTFSRHWIVSLEMAAVLLVIDVLVALGVLLLFLLLSVPFAFMIGSVQLYGSSVGFWLVIILVGVVAAAVMFVLGSLLTTFRYAAWTRLYLRLEERGAVAKIVRFLSAIPRWFHAK